MPLKWLISIASLLIAGIISLATSIPVSADYKTCMTLCMDEHAFAECHDVCRDMPAASDTAPAVSDTAPAHDPDFRGFTTCIINKKYTIEEREKFIYDDIVDAMDIVDTMRIKSDFRKH